jgi:hypothetical protein
MATDIIAAKRELYNTLKVHDGVTGAGIQEKNGSEFIVVFLSKTSDALKNIIPTEYKGNTVKTEVRSVARAINK